MRRETSPFRHLRVPATGSSLLGLHPCRRPWQGRTGTRERRPPGNFFGWLWGATPRSAPLIGAGCNWREQVDRAAKQALVTQLNASFKEAGAVVVTHYAGLTVAQMTDYRRRMKEAGGSVKVAKNRVVVLALKDTGAAGISDLFKGRLASPFRRIRSSAAKVTVKYAKDNEKLVILGGSMGTTVLDPKGVKALADPPSLDELRAKRPRPPPRRRPKSPARSRSREPSLRASFRRRQVRGVDERRLGQGGRLGARCSARWAARPARLQGSNPYSRKEVLKCLISQRSSKISEADRS